MTFIYSMIIAVFFVWMFHNQIKNKSVIFYCISIIISLLAVILVWGNFRLSTFMNSIVLPVIARGGLAGAFFIIVMLTGALPNGTKLIRILMPIRGELSIVASILTFGHNIAYGRHYYVALFSKNIELSVLQEIATICSLVMVLIILPLFLTSFKCIKRKMKGKNWKKLQRLAYLFYLLLGAHIMLLCVPNALVGKKGYTLTVIIYGSIFIAYALCRVMKALKIVNNKKLIFYDSISIIVAVLLVLITFSKIQNAYGINDLADENNQEIVVEQQMGFDEKLKNLPDGKYIGKAMGNSAYITVEVEVKNHTIEKVDVLSQSEDEPYWSYALEVIADIEKSNSVNVDAVSSATYSSEGIKDAVKNAIVDYR